MRMDDIRREPATSKQLWKLRGMGIYPLKGLSKKQASAMIDQRMRGLHYPDWIVKKSTATSGQIAKPT